MDTGFLILALLFLLCLTLRSVYELLKEAHKIDLENKPIFIAIFAAMMVLWVSWFTLCPKDPFPIDLPDAVRWTGLAVFIIGTILAGGALVQLRGVENIDHLVTTGLFSKLRHPMYAGFIAWILGWSLYHDALLSLAIGVIGIANVLWWRHLEERRLEAQYASTYHQYQRSTWF